MPLWRIALQPFFHGAWILETQLEEEQLGVPVHHVYVTVMTTMSYHMASYNYDLAVWLVMVASMDRVVKHCAHDWSTVLELGVEYIPR
jgi:hypothetical protein